MIDTRNPFEIARETLRQLTVRKLAPTPSNYQACYNDIAKLPNVAGFPEVPLRQLAAALPLRTLPQKTQLERLETAIGKRSWQSVQEAIAALIEATAAGGTGDAAVAAGGLPDFPADSELPGTLTQLIEGLRPIMGSEDPWFAEKVEEILSALGSAPIDMPGVLHQIAAFSQRLTLSAEEQAEIKQTLLKLLHLIIENIGELTFDDQCFSGQVDALLKAVEPPLNLRRLDDIERRLQDVIVRQREAKGRTREAQEEMRDLLAVFIEQLSVMSRSSTSFQTEIEEMAQEVSDTRTLEDLAPLLKRVIDTTRAMAEDTRNAGQQLRTLQEHVRVTEAELRRLNNELHSASASARHDPLTDALNRRGLDEALAREIACVRRKDTPLCLSLLDVDNFKRINDRLGHATGDSALIHLVNVVRQYMRPIDTLARYGGEEFVILMPDTTLEQGIDAMKRLQRELTKCFFLTGNERILITFSAGVAQLAAEESGDQAIRRADKAMYLAKRAGRNRVMGA